MHLLVIEDERALCETIVRSLRRLAYSVDYCYDGEKALELLGVERYDLVLLDLNLPGKDGMTVLRTLRQTDRETRVLILSARGEVEDKVEGLDAGANDYLAKPFHLAELEARIDTFLVHHPYLNRSEVPAEMVTASGSGLDPDITPTCAYVQVKRVAQARGMHEEQVKEIVDKTIEKPLLGLFGTEKVNVLKLNIALEKAK